MLSIIIAILMIAIATILGMWGYNKFLNKKPCNC